jgi:hypothetical protein
MLEGKYIYIPLEPNSGTDEQILLEAIQAYHFALYKNVGYILQAEQASLARFKMMYASIH